MDLKELLDLNEKIETRINAYWTYWWLVICAIAGWLFSKNNSLSREGAISVLIAVVVFFIANIGVLWPATRLATGIRDEIRLKTKEVNFLSHKLTSAFAEDTLAFRLQITFVLHIAVDLVVLWLLFREVQKSCA